MLVAAKPVDICFLLDPPPPNTHTRTHFPQFEATIQQLQQQQQHNYQQVVLLVPPTTAALPQGSLSPQIPQQREQRQPRQQQQQQWQLLQQQQHTADLARLFEELARQLGLRLHVLVPPRPQEQQQVQSQQQQQLSLSAVKALQDASQQSNDSTLQDSRLLDSSTSGAPGGVTSSSFKALIKSKVAAGLGFARRTAAAAVSALGAVSQAAAAPEQQQQQSVVDVMPDLPDLNMRLR
jgi:hypothetical protein